MFDIEVKPQFRRQGYANVRRAICMCHLPDWMCAVSSDPGFVEYVCDQIADAGDIASRKMFGEWAIYSGRKVVALVCDDHLFVRPTEAGRSFIGEPTESSPYPGARPHFLIEDRIDDRSWLTELIRLTEGALPAPKPKKGKSQQHAGGHTDLKA